MTGQTRRVSPGTIALVSALRHDEPLDAASRAWLERLFLGHPRHDETVASLHLIMRRMARRELARRRSELLSLTGREFDDVAQQAADDALINVLRKLDSFRGLSRFTTWVYKFVIFEVSTKVAAHAWQRQPPGFRESSWDLLSGRTWPGPEEALERQGQLQALRDAIGELTPHQRRVFVSIALNEVPIDVLALELGTNRNAIYKTLFDARRRLRALMATAGHPVGEVNGSEPRARDQL